VACGGGGGSSGAGTGGSGSGAGTGTGTGTGGTTTTPVGALSVRIFNSGGAPVTNVDGSGGFTARATVTDGSGAPVASKLVTFSLVDTALATITPANGTALTNGSGVAQVTIAPSSLSAVGATTITANATVGTTALSASLDFGVSASNLTLSAITAGSTALASGGNTSLSVTANVNGSPATSTPVNVSFGTSCGRINGGGTSASTTTNGSGVAGATYTAVAQDGSLCSGTVTITASAPGATAQTVNLTVAAATANAITYAGASPTQIFVQGTGAFEQSILTFRVLSGTTALANQSVTFSLVTNPGGVGLNAAGSTAPVTVTTDANGDARVNVFSGTIPGPVQVRAELANNASVFVLSSNFTVASGPPSQRFMSLSVSTFNIEAAETDGISTTLTVRLADRQGNAVQNGTVVNFTAEGGQVGSSCQTVIVGGISSCQVTFTSQNPRPVDGRVSVLAYTNGTKDYVDVNGNNTFDAGDTLVNIGDPYRDDNENGVFDAGEFVITRGGSAACASAGEPFPSRANTCDALLATTVRQQTVILFSSSNPDLFNVTATTSSVNFELGSRPYPLLPMPLGTTVAASVNDTTPANGLTCAVTRTVGTTVANASPGTLASANLRSSHSVALSGCANGDQVFIDIKAPGGLVTTFTIPIPTP
jgi:hypothetical protein